MKIDFLSMIAIGLFLIVDVNYHHSLNNSIGFDLIWKGEKMVRKTTLLVFVVMFCMVGSSWAGGVPEAYGRIVMEFDLSAQPEGEEARIWLPYPVANQYQDISDIMIDGDFAESAIYVDKKFQNSILYARWNRGGRRGGICF